MECSHAYITKNIDYVLCDFEPTPSRLNRTAIFHSMCGHQAHCPKENCHKLTAGWRQCTKLNATPQNAAGAKIGGAIPTQGKTAKKRTRKATAAKTEE